MSGLRLLLPLCAGAVTALALKWMLGRGRHRVPMDRPNDRSLHHVPVPRSGGLAMMLGGLPAMMCLGAPLPGVALIATGLCVLSTVDDALGIGAGARLLVHLFAAVLLTLVLPTGGGLAASAVLVISTVWMTNLYNFMDGSDGLAGGMTISGFGVYGVAAAAGGQGAFALACAVVVVVAFVFLLRNFHPASVFMGDGGSVPLGFLAAALGLQGVRLGLWAPWFPVLVFSPFIVDASVTLVRRLLRGERVWQAHRTHYYQRMVRGGAGHRRTALAAYALMAACGASALTARGWGAGPVAALLCGWVAVYTVLLRRVDTWWRALPEYDRAL